MKNRTVTCTITEHSGGYSLRCAGFPEMTFTDVPATKLFETMSLVTSVFHNEYLRAVIFEVE